MNRACLPFAIALVASTAALAEIPELGVPTAFFATAPPARPAGLEPAPKDAARLAFPAVARSLVADFEQWSAASPTVRMHVALDRPLYRPGDTVSLRVFSLATRGLASDGAPVTVELLDPRGTVAERKVLQGGVSAGTFALAPDAPGGTWTLRASGRSTAERSFAVESFEVPRVKKTLAFGRDGYAPGEEVEATVTLERSTGEPLADTVLAARLQADGAALEPIAATTDGRGRATVRFVVPADLRTPDVILTVTVDDGGVTEAVSRPVPVVLDEVRLALFPEGGDLVAGLPARVYFEATDAHGAPAHFEGVVKDDRGSSVAALESWVDGRGHFSFTPASGRAYHVQVGGTEVALPPVSDDGCVLRHHDDLDGVQRAIRLTVRCTRPRDVVLLATQQERVLDRAAVHVPGPVRGTTVHLRSGDEALAGAQGVARVTLLDGEASGPLAERLVYRNRGRQLRVAVEADRAEYAPGEAVRLRVRTTDPELRPVPADIAVAVVDDRLLAHADDDGDTLAARVLLQADLPEPIDGVAHLFEPDARDAGLGLDLALGTRGWRRFDWSRVRGFEARQRDEWWAQRKREVVDALEWAGEAAGAAMDWDVRPAAKSMARFDGPPQAPPASVSEPAKPKEAPARVFASPTLRVENVRSDFRDTVLWAPTVRTDARGIARLDFTLDDSVTGFRATAEGVGGGYVGRGDALLASRLPFSVDVRLPVELSAGDRLLVPVTLENARAEALSVALGAEVSSLFRLGDLPGDLSLRPGERTTVHVPLEALPGRGTASISLEALGAGASDAVEREIPVVPRGVPLRDTFSGVLEGGRARHAVTIPAAALEGSVQGRVVVFPSTVSELMEGVEAMVREPGGCFEQTSSTNYPNVLVLDWLERSGTGERLAADRQRVLEAGYRILTGYQVTSGGFETWGSGPGKEALSAYGLLQFSDMSRVYDVDPRILDENARYLYRQRNGRGGYEVSGASAHGYGTAPPEVLDAYITFALVETGHRDLDEEIDAQARLAARTNDPYRLALATLTLLEVRPDAGRAAAGRLAAIQADDGSFPGSETSITQSENQNLLVEATALATLALLRAEAYAPADEAVRWLHATRTGAGIWGATQANALALKALSEAATMFSAAAEDGRLTVRVDGKPAGVASYAAGQREPVTVDLALAPGAHTVEVDLGGGALPYAVEIGWSAATPPSDTDRRVDLALALADDALAVGDTTRLTARVTNRTADVVPDPIARIGIPAGLQPQHWQLEQLVARGEVAFFETRPREVTLYWDGIAPDEVHEVAIDLVAELPGTFTGPASAAYPYYDDHVRAWVEGLPVTVEP